MIRTILFPTDFSAVANGAFPLVTALARACGASVLALHVSTRETRGSGDPEHDFPEVPDHSVRVERSIISKSETEDYAEAIIRKARRRNCDLIVMASHGRSDVVQFFLGRSVSERVVRDSPVPAVVVRLYGARRTKRPVDRIARILLVTDLTREALAILPATVTIARGVGARIDVLCVFGEGDVQPADGGRAGAKKVLAEAGALDLLGDISTVRGGIAEAVVEHAAAGAADLIALTSTICSGSGERKTTRPAEFIIRYAPCPVLSVRP